MDDCESSLRLGNSSLVLLNDKCESSVHLLKLLLDLLVLGLSVAVAISVVTVTVWVVTIILTFSTETIRFDVIFVERLSFLFISDLGVGGDVAEDWASRVSVFVTSTDTSRASVESSMGLSDDPGKFSPAFVLGGDQSDLVNVSGSLIGLFLNFLPVLESSLDLLA